MKINVSRFLWNYIGYRAGWQPTILDKILASSKSLIKIAAVSHEDVAKAISDNLNLAGYDKGYTLRVNDNRIDVNQLPSD